jgi:Mn2+/Fe2+ NRAMP family transporter
MTETDRKSSGKLHTFLYLLKQGGPGWIQAAVTLGGGTLVTVLYLGVVGGYEFLWLQPLAMLSGVIMLFAISYVSLSIEDRPFQLAKKHVSPVLAWGWLVSAIIANLVFCSSQYALAADAIQQNLGGDEWHPFLISGLIFVTSVALMWLFSKEGTASRWVNQFIRVLVAVIVVCFFVVVAVLFANDSVGWGALLAGLTPDFSALFQPSASFSSYIESTGNFSEYWTTFIVDNQRNIIIGAFGTAVGINMTFLVPYALMKKKWIKKDRKLAGIDLITGLFIPFVIATSCLIIASASQFHANLDAIISETAYLQVLDGRLAAEYPEFNSLDQGTKDQLRANVPQADKDLSRMLASRTSLDLADSLTPILGRWAPLIFGIGALAMAVSTILVHMMINGYAIAEAFGKIDDRRVFFVGAIMPSFIGLWSPLLWTGTIRTSLVVPASVIATTMLPIAYLMVLLLMNSKKALGNEVPARRGLWNVLMAAATGLATFASIWALTGQAGSSNEFQRIMGTAGIIFLIVLALFGIVTFVRKELHSEKASV